MTRKRVPKGADVKFTAKYGVSTANIYKGNPDSMRIAPPGHKYHDATSSSEHDELLIAAIERYGLMNTPIEVLTDPDNGILWIVDGRRRWLATQEVNRRRAEQGREPVEPYITPFSRKNGSRPSEAEVVARIREKNYHRRVPTVSGMAVDLIAMRDAGCTWQQCIDALHVQSVDPEQWGRKLLPLGRCEPEVRAAVDARQIPRTAARLFGGSAADGSDALGRQGQLDLLAQMIAAKTTEKGSSEARPMTTAARERVVERLSNGAVEKLPEFEQSIARAIVAYECFTTGGIAEALDYLPEIKRLVVESRDARAKRGASSQTMDSSDGA